MKGGLCNRPFLPKQVGNVHYLLVPFELSRKDFLIGDLRALLEALLDDLPITGHCDYTFRPWHLMFKIYVAWTGHEMCEDTPTRDGVIGALEVNHL